MKQHILKFIYQAIINEFVCWITPNGIGIILDGIEYEIIIKQKEE